MIQWIGVVYFETVYILSLMGVLKTDNIVYAVIIAGGGVAAAIIGVIASICSANKHYKEIDKPLGFDKGDQSLAKKLGVGEKSITSQLGVGEKSITSQLGVGENDKSLTLQHKEMTKAIERQTGVADGVKSLTEQHEDIYTKVSDIAGILHDNQLRREAADTSKISLVNTMAAFQQSYIEMVNRNAELTAENVKLKEQLSQYLRQSDVSENTPDEQDNEKEEFDR